MTDIVERLRDPTPRWTDIMDDAADEIERLRGALAPLKRIADCYDANCLDAEARRFWGPDHDRRENSRDPAEIELYTGRGGARLLTLADCFKARAALKETGHE
jgi:hypothetical protein